MLLEFSCSNFKSIKEKVTFSAIATDNIKSEKYLKKFDDFRVLHTSVIYGPNGAGKSNIFKGIGMDGLGKSNAKPSDYILGRRHWFDDA